MEKNFGILQVLLFIFATSAAFGVQSEPTHYISRRMTSSAYERTTPPSANNENAIIQDSNTDINSSEKKDIELPQLPMSDPNDESIPTLKFGETLRLDALGPIIINTDGSTRRIDNWNELSEQEKEVSWRRISKRNEERRKALLMAAAAATTTATAPDSSQPDE